MSADEITRTIVELEEEMLLAADELRFEYAARLRDEIKELQRELEQAVGANPVVGYSAMPGSEADGHRGWVRPAAGTGHAERRGGSLLRLPRPAAPVGAGLPTDA